MTTRSEQHEAELRVAAEIRDFLMESTSLIIEGVSDGARDRGESFLTVLMGVTAFGGRLVADGILGATEDLKGTGAFRRETATLCADKFRQWLMDEIEAHEEAERSQKGAPREPANDEFH
jgi:hypothetical protein